MATVNINSNWTYTRSASVVSVTANTSTVSFGISDDYNGYQEYAKAYIPISNINQYTSITLKYSSFYSSGIYDFRFGVFDSTNSTSSSGKVSSHTFSKTGGTVTISGLSSLSGTKYVGFFFYGNATSPGVNNEGYPFTTISINSLTAVPAGYTVTYNANGGSGTTNSQTVTVGESITLQANGFTAPSSAVHGITLYDSDGTTQISSSYASFQNNVFYKWLIGSTYYQPGATYTPASNTTVKATWSTNYKLNSASKQSTSSAGYIITYNPNGGNCSREEDIITDTIYYDFSKWISVSSGNEYESGSILGGPNAYSYKAKWTTSKELGSIILPNAYKDNSEIIVTVTLNPNKGKCDIISMTSKGITAYSFNGWYSGNNYIGTVGTSYIPSSNITLTANYTSSTGSYNQIFLPTPYRSGYKFLGWSTNPDANSGIFGYYTPTGNDTLYAIWQENIIFININGSIKKVQAFIFNDNKWNKIQTFISSNDQWNKTG